MSDLDRVDDVGLIHADLHLGNSLFHGGEVKLIDFDLWYTGMGQVNPAFAARLDRIHRWSLAMLDEVETPSRQV